MKPLRLLILLLFTQNLQAQYFSADSNTVITSNAGDSRSVNWVNVNNDIWTDLMITNGPSGGQNNFLYININGVFSLVTTDPIVSDFTPSDGATWGDMDNDGDIDAFVVNWYNVNNLMYLNDGNGSFTELTTGQPVNDQGYSETASWGDYDNDGLLDLYVTNSAGNLRNFLYQNQGNGVFQKITTGSLVTDQHTSRCVNWTDMDNDNDLDLFIANENNQNENIYRNDGAGVFTKITVGALVNDQSSTMSASWGDIDNDGDLDCFLANNGDNNALFRNDGNMNFTKLVNDTVSKCGGHSFSSAWSDIDNDGDIDLYVTNAFGLSLYNNYLFINDGSGNFTRVQDASVSGLHWSYGCAFSDYDNDGYEDLAVATCRYNNIDRNDLLFRNSGFGNNFLSVKLIGFTSNKSAIGAKIRVHAIINGQSVWQMREISAQSSYCGQNDMRVTFGLGNAVSADTIYIEWPSGLREYYVNQQAQQFYTFTEGQGTTGVNETEENIFQVFPNPSAGLLKIRSHSLLNAGDEIRISNTLNQCLHSVYIDNDTFDYNIDLQKLNINGWIMIQLVSKNKTHIMKAIIK